MLFIGGLIALFVLLANLGPMILLGVSVWLLYIAFKQFIKSNSIAAKIGWVIAGLIVLSVAVANIYAVIGLAAAYVLYVIYKKWHGGKNEDEWEAKTTDDPFTNFEKQWAEMKNY
nr:DUF2681 domain-containing protein [Thalassobacillus pellis]